MPLAEVLFIINKMVKITNCAVRVLQPFFVVRVQRDGCIALQHKLGSKHVING